MVLKDPKRRAKVIATAIELLNSKKHTDFKLESCKMRDSGILATRISSKKFSDAAEAEFWFGGEFFSDKPILLDRFTDYGELTGEEKIIARFACYLNACYHMPGQATTYLKQRAGVPPEE